MIGKTVLQYRILEEIGRGAMAIVFRAEDTVAGRTVALKIMKEKLADDPEMLYRFEREALAASRLHHRHICQVFDSGVWSKRPYLAMEFLTGQALSERLAAGPLAPATVMDIAISVASALEASHSVGVVHRDIKPANLFLSADGDVKVLDFGLAKVRPQARPVDSPTATVFITRPGTLVGTLAYMSPEQIRCEAVDGRSDLYSLGVLLYELATGELPMRGSERGTALPWGLEPIVTRLMEIDPKKRYQSAAEAREALQACAVREAYQRCGTRPTVG